MFENDCEKPAFQPDDVPSLFKITEKIVDKPSGNEVINDRNTKPTTKILIFVRLNNSKTKRGKKYAVIITQIAKTKNNAHNCQGEDHNDSKN